MSDLDAARENVIHRITEEKVRFINLWFTDIMGKLKCFSITRTELENALSEGMGFDGSSIEGFTRIHESDMIALPDPMTFSVLPWDTHNEKVGRMFCNIMTPEGQPYMNDPRQVLKKIISKLDKLGYTAHFGPEIEYFYFKNNHSTEFLDHAGYFDMTPTDAAISLRSQTIDALEKMGIIVEYSHHEVSPSQHEIDLRFAEPLVMADTCMTYKLIVKQIAEMNDCFASFMPKPITGINGSGMHTHVSLSKNGKNAFFDKDGEYYLSDIARSFLSGILKYVPEFTVVTNPTVNSYKRLVPGFEAPVYISWGQRNRSALVRVPRYKPGRESATRIELRSPDPSCNPYLAFAVILGAGLKGIEEKLSPPVPTESNIFEFSPEEMTSHGITYLPGDLHEALTIAEHSSFLEEVLGEELHKKFIANRRAEWDLYKTQVSEYELKRYLPIL